MRVAREWYPQGRVRYVQEGGDNGILLIMDLEGMGRANRSQERGKDYIRLGPV